MYFRVFLRSVSGIHPRFSANYFLIVFIAAFGSLITPVNAVGSVARGSLSWSSEKVQEPRYFREGAHSQLIDKSGRLNIFYGGNHLYQAIRTTGGWSHEVIDDSPRVGLFATAVVDTSINFHVVYCDDYRGFAKYATNAGGIWKIEQISKQVVPDCRSSNHIGKFSIAIDTSGVVHLALQKGDGGSDILYANNFGGTWKAITPNILAGTPYLGSWARVSIALDKLERPNIVFSSSLDPASPPVLVHGALISNKWTLTTINSGGCNGICPITFDSKGFAHVALDSGQALYYATNTSGSWVTELVEASILDMFTGLSPGLEVEANGRVHIGYIRSYQDNIGGSTSTSNTQLRYATKSSGSWSIQPVETLDLYNPGDVSMSLDNAGAIHLSYFNLVSGTIRSITQSKTGWAIEVVDTSDEDPRPLFAPLFPLREETSPLVTGEKSAMALDSAGYMHVVYQVSGAYYAVNYATNKSGTWQRTTLASAMYASTTTPYEYAKIAVDSKDHVHVALFDGDGAVHHLTNGSGTWTDTTLLPASGGIQGSVSLALDELDHAHIAVKKLYGDIWYATNQSGLWKVETVIPADPNIRLYDRMPTIAIGVAKSGLVQIGFVNASYYPAELVLAKRINSSWEINTVAKSDEMHPWGTNDISFTSNGALFFAYEVSVCTNFCFPDGIRLSSNSSGSWKTEVVDQDVWVTKEQFARLSNPSIAVTSADDVRISYKYETYFNIGVEQIKLGQLRLARLVGSFWRTSIVDEWNDDAPMSSVAISKSNQALISYFDVPNRALRVASSLTIPAPLIDISMTDSSIDFGSIPVGKTASKKMTITNRGDKDLMVSSIKLTSGNIDSFAIDTTAGNDSCGSLTKTIAPDQSCSFSIVFTPKSAGTFEADVDIESNDSELPVITSNFVGATLVQPASESHSDSNKRGGGGLFFVNGTSFLGSIFETVIPLLGMCLAFRARYSRRRPTAAFNSLPLESQR